MTQSNIKQAVEKVITVIDVILAVLQPPTLNDQEAKLLHNHLQQARELLEKE